MAILLDLGHDAAPPASSGGFDDAIQGRACSSPLRHGGSTSTSWPQPNGVNIPPCTRVCTRESDLQACGSAIGALAHADVPKMTVF